MRLRLSKISETWLLVMWIVMVQVIVNTSLYLAHRAEQVTVGQGFRAVVLAGLIMTLVLAVRERHIHEDAMAEFAQRADAVHIIRCRELAAHRKQQSIDDKEGKWIW